MAECRWACCFLIFSEVATGATPKIRCNVSSWYVEPAFRSFASLLVLRALKNKDVTYLNISPAPATRARPSRRRDSPATAAASSSRCRCSAAGRRNYRYSRSRRSRGRMTPLRRRNSICSRPMPNSAASASGAHRTAASILLHSCHAHRQGSRSRDATRLLPRPAGFRAICPAARPLSGAPRPAAGLDWMQPARSPASSASISPATDRNISKAPTRRDLRRSRLHRRRCLGALRLSGSIEACGSASHETPSFRARRFAAPRNDVPICFQ